MTWCIKSVELDLIVDAVQNLIFKKYIPTDHVNISVIVQCHNTLLP